MNINVPKSMLPDCAVGETVEMKITGEDGDSFIMSPYETEATDEVDKKPAATKPAKGKVAKGKRPAAVAKALKIYTSDE
jgi:hypothetical protein